MAAVKRRLRMSVIVGVHGMNVNTHLGLVNVGSSYAERQETTFVLSKEDFAHETL